MIYLCSMEKGEASLADNAPKCLAARPRTPVSPLLFKNKL